MKATTKILFIVVYSTYILWILILASVPPVSRDALTHHLAIPKLWVEHGGMYEIPAILFSYYPQLIDILYTLPILFDHDIAAKYIHFSFALLTALTIFLFVRRKIGAAWGALAGLLFLTIPLIVKLSVTVYVDLGLIFFTTVALFSIVIWIEDTQRSKWLILAAICSGLALSTKYNAIISFLILSLIVPFFFLNSRKNKHEEQFSAIKFALFFLFLSLLVFSPWLIRNVSLTGNPIYPMHHKQFSNQPSVSIDTNQHSNGEDYIRQTVEQNLLGSTKALGSLLTRKLVYDESLPYTLLIPLRIFYEGADDNPQYFDGKLNPLLLILPLVLLLLRKHARFHVREMGVFWAFSLLMVLLTFFTTDMRARYIATIIPPLVVLSACSLYGIHRWLLHRNLSKSTAGIIVSFLVAVYLFPNFRYSYELYKKIDPVPFLSGQTSRPAYIQKYRKEYATIALANEIVPQDGKVLGLYLGNRRYYFSVDAVLLNNLYTRISEESSSAQILSSKLKELGFTHILLHEDLFSRWLSGTQNGTKRTVRQFFSRLTTKISAREGYVLYEIL